MTSPMFNLPGRLVLGSHCYHEQLPALLPEILQRIARGETMPGDTERLTDVGWTMSDASLCGLGQTAASAVLSALQLWPHLFEPVQIKP